MRLALGQTQDLQLASRIEQLLERSTGSVPPPPISLQASSITLVFFHQIQMSSFFQRIEPTTVPQTNGWRHRSRHVRHPQGPLRRAHEGSGSVGRLGKAHVHSHYAQQRLKILKILRPHLLYISCFLILMAFERKGGWFRVFLLMEAEIKVSWNHPLRFFSYGRMTHLMCPRCWDVTVLA